MARNAPAPSASRIAWPRGTRWFRKIAPTKKASTMAPKANDIHQQLTKLRKLLESRESSLQWHYDVGACLRTIHSLGKASVAAVVAKLQQPKTLVPVLQAARLFATRYTRTDLKRLQKHALKWSLVVQLASAPVERRDKLEQKCIAKHWTVKQLNAALLKQGQKRSQGGRSIKSPPWSGAKLLIDEMIRFAKHWDARCTIHLDRLEQELRKSGTGGLSLDERRAAADRLRTLQLSLSKTVQSLRGRSGK